MDFGHIEKIPGECPAQVENFSEAESLIFVSYGNLKQKFGEDHEQTQNALKRVEKFESEFLK